MRGVAVIAPALLGALAACDPVWHLHARVVAAPPCSSAVSSASPAAAPIEGASVRVECPGLPPRQPVQTRADGRATLSAMGFMPGCTYGRCSDDPGRGSDGAATPSCQVVIEKPGYVSQRYPLGSFCQAYAGDRCFRAALTVELSPASTMVATPAR